MRAFLTNSFTKSLRFGALALLTILFVGYVSVLRVMAQTTPQPRGQEVSDDEGIPVLIKHLPDWQNVRSRAMFANNGRDLQNTLGARPILNLIEFVSGTEAVTADYDAGKLVIVEFPTPQFSVAADERINQFLAGPGQNSQTVYRRIGNYNAMVLDAPDAAAAGSLLDQVKYEKGVQWLGENPFLQKRAERNFVVTTSDIFLSTVIVIVFGIGLSIVGGLGVGVVFFFFRERERASRTEYTDAGGMTRLNLDGYTPDIAAPGLLRD